MLEINLILFIPSSRVKVKKTKKVDILWNREVHKYSVFQTHTFWKLQVQTTKHL